MGKRPYVQTQRAESAEDKRRRIVRAARELPAADAPAQRSRSTPSPRRRARHGPPSTWPSGTAAGSSRRSRSSCSSTWASTGSSPPSPHEDPLEALRGSFAEAARLYAADRPVARALWSWGELEPDAAGAIGVLEHGRWEGMVHLARRLRDAGHLRADRTVTEAAEALWVLTSFDAFDQLFTGRDLTPGAVAERLTMMAESALLDLA